MYWKLIYCISTIILVSAENKTILNRIVGGRDVSIRSAPWQVSLRMNTHHICGGSIYSKDIVITAAHCTVKTNKHLLSVGVGSTDRFEKSVSMIEQVYVHEKFALSHMLYDVSVLLLSTPLSLSESVQSIPLAQIAPPTGSQAMVSGWGKTDEKAMSLPDNLQAVYVNILDNEKCKNSYPGEHIGAVSLCAAARGKDACQGDSGGPLVYKRELVGIVSWGYGCASPKYPGVYTNVAVLHNWIEQAIKVLSRRSFSRRIKV